MNSTMTQLTHSLTGKASLAELSLSELQQLAGQYPYWGPVQVLIAGKLAQDNAAGLDVQLERSMLYMANPLRLKQLLAPELDADVKLPWQAPEIAEPAIEEEPAFTEQYAAQLETPATHEEVVIQSIENEPEISPVADTLPEEPVKSALEATQAALQAIPNLPGTDKLPQDLSFEPYHTVDYFASLGIRIKEDKSADRFSQQLRSFTEWLKTLKKLPNADEAVAGNAHEERKVAQLAEHSIQNRDVVTEAMAEVWEKQGDLAQAIRVYEKLSLLDPAKSSYFAAKIDQLKHA